MAKRKIIQKKRMPYPKGTRAKRKIKKVMEEWKEKKLRTGSKRGPIVKSQKQAIAIALSEARKRKKTCPRPRKQA